MLFGFTNTFLANVFASTIKQNNQKPHNFVTKDQEAQLAQTNSSIPTYAKRFSQFARRRMRAGLSKTACRELSRNAKSVVIINQAICKFILV